MGVGGPALIGLLTHNMLVEYTLVPAVYLPGQFFLVYMLLYTIVPRYILKARYRQAIWWTALLILGGAIISALMYATLIDPIRTHFMVYNGIRFQSPNWVENLPTGFIFSLRAVVTVAGFATAIKLMKHWYEKEYRNNILQKEKLDAELQSLKAQLHPHFLFNTLNNIYSITENVSPAATDILLKLSALLRYILYECNLPLVKLSQECRLVEDYIALEKIRYTDIDLVLNLPANTDQYSIAPLLLLPLVENCFKHGTSKVLEQPWINITLEIKDGVLLAKLINGKPATVEGLAIKEGIGLANVKRRLGLLYPNMHDLVIIAEEDVFIVQLKLSLSAA